MSGSINYPLLVVDGGDPLIQNPQMDVIYYEKHHGNNNTHSLTSSCFNSTVDIDQINKPTCVINKLCVVEWNSWANIVYPPLSGSGVYRPGASGHLSLI